MRLCERIVITLIGACALVIAELPAASAATVTVSTSAQLASALSAASPGTVIQLAANTTFAGNFKATKSGTSTSRITLQGPRSAVLKATRGRGFELTGSYWTLDGFTITGGQKGLMALGVHDTLVNNLKVTAVGHEGIHFQYTSTDNVVQNSEVSDTGRQKAGYGEGIYIGSAVSNWLGGLPDRSDRNKVLTSKIGPQVRAESIDIKEGTTGGELTGNTFDGTGQTGAKHADGWVDIKGNGYLVNHNKGSKVFVHDAAYGGFEVHVEVVGWGQNNTFSGNTSDPQSPYAYGFYVAKTGVGNKVCTSNTATNAGKGFANVAATTGC
jgi:hypothetical protein